MSINQFFVKQGPFSLKKIINNIGCNGDFTHVNDVVDAIIKSLVNKDAKGQIMNVGSGKPRKIKSIIEQVKKITKGGYPEYGKIKFRKDEILKLYPSINKISRILGWRPKTNFDEGLVKTINYYKTIKQK